LGAAQVTWKDQSGKIVRFDNSNTVSLLPSAKRVFSFARNSTATLDLFATTPERVAEFKVPPDLVIEKSKAQSIIEALRAHKTCYAAVSGSGTLDRLVNTTYTIQVDYSKDSPESSRWMASGFASREGSMWTMGQSAAYDRGIGDPVDRIFWIISVPFSLQDDGQIVSALKSTNGTPWRGSVTCQG
jgi:hypothetical protein